MTTHRTQTVTAETVEGYRGTFAAGEDPRGPRDELPPGWEGILFPFAAPLAGLRPDGSPANDGVIPETDLPRRLYAGETTEYFAPIRIGDAVEQTARLASAVEKTGSNGRLQFVDVERDYTVGGTLAIRSVWHDVFLEKADPSAPTRPPKRDPDAVAGADWTEEVTLDIRALFRFSALTFNTHLVHFDRSWAREEEGLEDLLVHGPLTRILLMDAARRHHPDRRAATLAVRATHPAFVDRPLRLAGRTRGQVTTVVALDETDIVVATAEIGWAAP